MSEVGKEFETKCKMALERLTAQGTVIGEIEIANRYGPACRGVDILVNSNNKRIFIQCKWEIQAPKLNAVNHFIQTVDNIENKIEDHFEIRAFYVSRRAPATASKAAIADKPGFDFIHAAGGDNFADSIRPLLQKSSEFLGITSNIELIISDILPPLNPMIATAAAERLRYETEYNTQIANLKNCVQYLFSSGVANVESYHDQTIADEYVKQNKFKDLTKLLLKYVDTWQFAGDPNRNNKIVQCFIILKQIEWSGKWLNANSSKKIYKEYPLHEPTYNQYRYSEKYGALSLFTRSPKTDAEAPKKFKKEWPKT